MAARYGRSMVVAQHNGSTPGRSSGGRARAALGALESKLMEALWGSASELSVQGVSDALGPGHHYKTVMTVLNRLVGKGLLTRELDGRAYRYRPSQTRPQFLRSAADELVRGYIDAYGPDAAEHLANAAGTGPSQQAPPRPEARATMTGDGGDSGQPRSPLRLMLIVAVLLLLFVRARRGRS